MRELYVLTLILALMESRGYASRHDQANEEPNKDSQNNMHNVTMDCGDYRVLLKTVTVCERGLWRLYSKGNIWFGHGIQTRAGNNQSARNGTDNLRDSLNSLDYTCHIQDRFRKCLEENSVGDYCLSTISSALQVDVDVQFICRHQRRDENLIRALQCLHDKRVLAMLFFHIGNHCFRGMDILDDLMTRMKNALLYALDVNLPFEVPQIYTQLYCLPSHVISTCVGGIVQKHCGKMSSEVVQNYLLYFQDRVDLSLKSVGLSPNICEYETHSNITLTIPPMLEHHEKLDFVRGLEMAAPGTALDTVWGRMLVSLLQKVSGWELCGPQADSAYTACVISSDDKYERSKFNILQFGHGFNIPLIYHGTHCLRLEQFTGCWNQLQEMCGDKVRGFAQHATLLVEGCKIQSEMDTAGCHWQDMLLGHYIQASHVTVWPLRGQGLFDPLFLESLSSTTKVTKDLDMVITLLQPGVEEIATKCGQQPARRLQAVLQQLRNLQHDALKMSQLLVNSIHAV